MEEKGFNLMGGVAYSCVRGSWCGGGSSLLAPSSTFPQTEFKNSPFWKSIQFRILDFPRAFGDIKTVFFSFLFFFMPFLFTGPRKVMYGGHT